MLTIMQLQQCRYVVMQGQSNFSEAWTRAQDRAQAAFDMVLHQEQLPIVYDLFRQIGPIGDRFLEEFFATGCRPRTDMSLLNTTTNATGPAYHYFKRGLLNNLNLNPGITNSLRWTFGATAHDGTHAREWEVCAANHANSWNNQTRYVLAPRYDAIRIEKSERNTYAKQLLLERLRDCLGPWNDGVTAIDSRPQILSVMPDGSFDVDEEAIENLRQYALSGIDQERMGGSTFLHHYYDACLNDWEAGADLRQKNNDLNIEYVMPDAHDLLKLGDSLGISIFGTDPEPVLRCFDMPLPSSAHEERVQRLNRKVGIGNDRNLRTLSQALASEGKTLQQYIAECRGDKPLAFPCPMAAPVPLQLAG